MKNLILFTALIATGAQAQTRGSLDGQIESSVAGLSRSVIERRAHLNLNDGAKRELLSILRDAGRVLRGGGNNPDPVYPGYGMQVRAFSDDRCQNLIVEVKPQDNCSMLTNVFSNRNVWSIAIGNQCIDTSDRSFSQSCESLRGLAMQPAIERPVVQLYTDDRCQNPLIALDPSVNYEAIQPFLSNSNVWSVQVEGKCVDTSDRKFNGTEANNMVRAALQMRQYANGEAFELYSDDRCQNPVTVVQRGNSCEGLNLFYGNQKVWSIKFRGGCQDISDMTFPQACATYTR